MDPSAIESIERESPFAYAALSRLSGFANVAVLDTSCVRTGIAQQVSRGRIPASLSTAQDGTIHLYVEERTLTEIYEKLPEFGQQLGVKTETMSRIFDEDWLPYLRVVALPPELESLDRRAALVAKNDIDDFPAACLASLLAPCILLTHNYRDFRPLNIESSHQGVRAVLEAINIKLAEEQLQSIGTLVGVPILATGAGVRWLVSRNSPALWAAAGALILAGYIAYRDQPLERQQNLNAGVAAVGRFVLEKNEEATALAAESNERLGAYMVPVSDETSPFAFAVAQLARATRSLSAQQLFDRLSGAPGPSVHTLRELLYRYEGRLFTQTGRGSFALGVSRLGYFPNPT